MNANDVRVALYRGFTERGGAPSSPELAAELGMSIEAVEAALEELSSDDVIALLPGTHTVWLAHPFSSGTERFQAHSGGRSWDAICIWDALGILALLGVDGAVTGTCPDCDESLELQVSGGEMAPTDHVVHFEVPAARWYEDIAYT